MNLSNWRLPLLSALTAILFSTAIQAESSYYTAFQNAYPNSLSDTNVATGTGSSCLLCHGVGSYSRFNGYGWKLRELMNGGMNINQALAAAEPFDSDVDPTGSSSIVEIDADTQPGWTDGANNTVYRTSGSHQYNQNPPAGILGTLDPVEPGVGYCSGAPGVGTPCPCSNDNNGSTGGCDWGSAAFPGGGLLTATGSASAAANDTFLVASDIENNFGIFFGANTRVNGGNGNPLNDGLRCAGGGLVRLISPTMASGHQAVLPQPVQTLDPGATSGATRRYQYWFRTPGGPCATSANLTNGYEIVWMP